LWDVHDAFGFPHDGQPEGFQEMCVCAERASDELFGFRIEFVQRGQVGLPTAKGLQFLDLSGEDHSIRHNKTSHLVQAGHPLYDSLGTWSMSPGQELWLLQGCWLQD